MKNSCRFITIAAVVVLSGCGSIDPEKEACQQSLGEDYLPFSKRSAWKYEITDPTRDVWLGEKTNTIIEQHGDTVKLEVGGVLRPGLRWLHGDGSSYRWLRNLYFDSVTHEPASDQYYDGPALRFDASRTDPEVSWEESYEKSSIDIAKCPDYSASLGEQNLKICPADSLTFETVTETWTVYAVDEMLSSVRARLERRPDAVGVPAGDFSVVCHERVCDAAACISGVYCFAPGVGKVYELSSEREELTSVCLKRP